jgi:2-dehydropantoate 2-reductase
MRILVIGAGSIGGYFGGRLHEAGRDVTFLVREKRAKLLRENGLRIKSNAGDVHIERPVTVLASQISEPYDLIILSCKAYDLEDAVASLSPAVGPKTVILPLLNGMRHLDVLDEKFGADRVYGGQCMISTTLDYDGGIVHMGDLQSLVFGPRTSQPAAEAQDVLEALANAPFDVRKSDEIEQEMWQKWVFIASSAGITTLMRASVGDIVEAGGVLLVEQLVEECSAVAAANGHAPALESRQRTLTLLTTKGSPMTASMFRDIESGARIEADQIIGDLIARAPQNVQTPLLRTVFVGLKAYEARRARETQKARQ